MVAAAPCLGRRTCTIPYYVLLRFSNASLISSFAPCRTPQEAQRVISFEKNEAAIGRVVEALVDETVTDDGEYVAVARTRAQALEGRQRRGF